MKKIKAFTLAEVLITLAIIGVVAALTIPTLITNYQKHQYVTQLKKNYNVIQNGFKSYIAKNGVFNLSDTPLFAVHASSGYSWNDSKRLEFQAELGKIFKISKSTISSTGIGIDYSPIGESNNSIVSTLGTELKRNPSFYLSDGTLIYYRCNKNPEELTDSEFGQYLTKAKNMGGHLFSALCQIYVDVNGNKGPNVAGRDLFMFFLDNKGALWAQGSSDVGIFRFRAYMNERPSQYDENKWQYTWEDEGIPATCCYKDVQSTGLGCTGRVIDKGWVMDY